MRVGQVGNEYGFCIELEIFCLVQGVVVFLYQLVYVIWKYGFDFVRCFDFFEDFYVSFFDF